MPYQYRSQKMGTHISLLLLEQNDLLAHRIFLLLDKIESLFTINRTQSDVIAINQAAGVAPIQVNRWVFEVIDYAKQASVLPESRFNLAIGPLVKLWRIGFADHCIPDPEHIKQALVLTDPCQVKLESDKSTVFLMRKGMALDLGAIAKGYAADLVAALLQQFGVENAVINLGGQIRAIGTLSQNANRKWQIGIQKPFSKPGTLLGKLNVANRSVVTSGIYERFFMSENQHYHHILDPSTGYPLNNDLESVTVMCDSSTTGEIYSTYLFGLGLQKGLAYLNKCAHIEALFVTRDKRIICSHRDRIEFTQSDNTYRFVQVD